MGYLALLPAVLLPVIALTGWIVTSRTPRGQEVLRRQRRYVRNNLVLGVVLAILAIAFGLHMR